MHFKLIYLYLRTTGSRHFTASSMKALFFPTGLAIAALTLGSCSLGHSASDDVNSSNPAVAAQAQKVVELQQQVDAQKKAVKDQERVVKSRENAVDSQKDVADTEKQKLDGLQQQLDGAKQNLKGVKTQAKTN